MSNKHKPTPRVTTTAEGYLPVCQSSARDQLLTALEAAGPAGLLLEDLEALPLTDGWQDALNTLLSEGLAGHPPVTTRLYIVTARGRAYMALQRNK